MSHEIYELLAFLDEECLSYRLDRVRPNAITVTLMLSGERLEITVFSDARVESQRLVGADNVGSNSAATAKLYERLEAARSRSGKAGFNPKFHWNASFLKH